MYVIGGSASLSVSQDLSRKLKIPLAKTISKRFPDGETYVRIIDDIFGEDVIIVQTTYPDTNIIELLLIQEASLESGAKNITVVIPYFGYARQDKKFKIGEPISAKLMAQLISKSAKKIITVDPHKDHILEFFPIKAQSCTAVQELATFLKKKNIDLVLAPDKGALSRARQASQILKCEFDFIEKKRIDGSTVEITPKNLETAGNNVAIIDDIISTGNTMAKSIIELKKQGANKIYVSCTHGLFTGDAIKNLKKAGCDEIISTDTIISEFSKVKVAPSIVKKLKTKQS
jgi:ribose-phosphate pyrophosphokinase